MQGRDALSDQLSVVTEIFDEKIEEYRATHPNVRHPSNRAMRIEFMKSAKLHKSYVTSAVRMAARQTKSAEKPGGMAVLLHVKNHLISSGEAYRADPKPSLRNPGIPKMIEKNEMLDESIMLKRWRHQITYLRVVAAEVEAMALALFLDHKLLEQGTIQKNQKITKCSKIWKFSRFSERNIDLVRHLYVS